MSALYQAFLGGTITDNPLTSGATSFNSTGLASMPVVASPDTMWVILDPTGVGGTPEIVQVTAHTSAATSATIVRGQQTAKGGSAARAHVAGIGWMSGPTPEDLARHAGRWYRDTALSLPNGATTNVTMNQEAEDTDNFLTPTSATATIPAGLGGLYLISAGVQCSNITASRGRMQLDLAAGTGVLPAGTPSAVRTNMIGESDNSVAGLIQLAAGNTVTVSVFHSTGTAINANTAFLSLMLLRPG